MSSAAGLTRSFGGRSRVRRRAPSSVPVGVVLLIVGWLVVGWVVVGPAVTGSASALAVGVPGPGAQPDPLSRVAVLVDTLEPAVPGPRDVLRVSGSVLNRAAERFGDLQVSLHLGAPVADRSQLDQLRNEPVAQPLASRPTRLGSGSLEPGAHASFTLTAPVQDLLTRGPGVYPLQVTVVGRTTEGLRDLGSADSFLPYVPAPTAGAAAPPPLRIAWILPLVEDPQLAPTGVAPGSGLATDLADGGDLDAVLAAAEALPSATLATDPALLTAVQALARRHPAGPTSGPVQPPDPSAQAWLDRLTARLGSNGPGGGRLDAVRIPFANADVESLLHAGRDDLAQRVVDRSQSAFRAVVGQDGSTELALPPDGRIDRLGADFLARNGSTAAVLAPDAVSGPGTVSTTASVGTGSAGGPSSSLTPVVPDPELTRLLAAGTAGEPTSRLAEQSVLAELAQAYLSATASRSTDPLVLAPPSSWSPGNGWAARIAADSAGVPWLRPIGLTELASSERGRATGRRTELSYPDAARAAELNPVLIPPVSASLADAAGFAEALPSSQVVTQPVTDTALSALSASWRTNPGGSDARRRSADDGLDQLRRSVRVVASPEITLTSRNGRLPVTLENNLPDPVNVTLVLTSLDRSRVRSDTSVSRTIQPGQKVQVEVTVRATSAGTFPVRLALQTPTGRPIGPANQVLVRSTAAGVVAVGVTVAALAVLLLAVLGRAIRTLLRHRGGGRPADGPPAADAPREGQGSDSQVPV